MTDPDVISAFERERLRFAVSPNPKAVLLRVAERQGYDPEEIAYLATLPSSTFKELLQSARGDDLENIIRGGLLFERIGNADNAMRELASKVRQALEEIASTSKLNALRVQNITGIAAR